MARRVGTVVQVVAFAGFAAACGSFSGTAAAAQAVVNKQVAEAITEAKKLSSKKQWSAAVAALRKAEQAPEKTAYADYKIDEFMAYLLTQQRKYGEAAALYDRIARSDQASSRERDRHLKTAAQLYLQAKQYSKAAAVAARGLKADPRDRTLLEIAGNAQFLAQDYKSAANTMERLVSLVEKQGGKPEESWLQIMLNSYYKLENNERVADAWQALLRHHPDPKYWRNVLELRTAQTQPEPIELGYRTLMFDLGLLDDPRDYEELALTAIDNGAPGEAVRVLQAGFDKDVLTGPSRARFERMLAHAKQEAAKTDAYLAEMARQAQKANTGQPSVALGRAYLGAGRYEQAIAALQRGLKQGRIENPDQARVQLGIAYLKQDKPKQAQEVFASIAQDSEWRDLAELWSLRARNVASGEAATGG